MPVIKKTFSHTLESNALHPYNLQTAGGYVTLLNCYPTATLQFYDDLVSMLDEINESGLLSDEDLIKHYKYSYFRSNSSSYQGSVLNSSKYWNNRYALIGCSNQDLLPLSRYPNAYSNTSNNNIATISSNIVLYYPYYNKEENLQMGMIYCKSAPVITIFGVPFYLFCDSLYTMNTYSVLNKNSVRPHFAPVYGYNDFKTFSLKYRFINNANDSSTNYNFNNYSTDEILGIYNNIASYQNILKLEYTIIIQYNTDYINISIKIPSENVYNKGYYNKGIINLGLFVKGKNKVTEENVVFACANPNLYNTSFYVVAKILYPDKYGESGCKKTIYNYDATTSKYTITSSDLINTSTNATAETNYNYLFQKNGFLDARYSLYKSFNITDPNLILLQNPICCFGLIEFSDNFKTGPTLYQINPCEYYEINNETYYVPSTCCGFNGSNPSTNNNGNSIYAAYLLKL